MSLYEIAVLGSPEPGERAALLETLSGMVQEFGLELGADVVIRDSETIGDRDLRAALAACYFVGPLAEAELAAAAEVVKATAPIIPTIGPLQDFAEVPLALKSANGLRRRVDDLAQSELAVALLECVGLLRVQRRVFVSYRRLESRAAALQLHDYLSSRGFDVFLDTHDIRPGEPFQDVLWHRLCDSDVLIMLDTPGYFESKWTQQELHRALAKDIQVLRVVWPGHTPSRHTDLADTRYLTPADLAGADGPLVDQIVDEIGLSVEMLRSRSLASRHRLMTGKLRAEVQKIGGDLEAIGAYRAVALRLSDGRRIWAYPIIGIPTAELLHDVAERSARAGNAGFPALIYDHVGIRDRWVDHLKWLESKIADVHWIRVAEAGWALAALD